MDQQLFYQGFSFKENHRMIRHVTDASHGSCRHYIACLKKGEARFISKTEEIILQPGDYIYVPYHCRYQSIWTGKPEIIYDHIGFRYFPEKDLRPMPMQKLKMNDELRALCAGIVAAQAVSCQTVGMLYQALAVLLPGMEKETLTPRQEAAEMATQMIRKNPEIKAPELAKGCGMSESSLYSAFKEFYGITPVEMKHRILAEKAEEMLLDTENTVEEISRMLKLSSAAYLRKILREQLGKTPKEIRRDGGV